MSQTQRPECVAMSEQLVAYVDGELSAAAQAEVAAHVTGCLPCRREVASVKAMDRLLATLPRLEPASDLAARMQQRLDEAAGAGRRAGRGWVSGWGVALAAAAAVALALVSILNRAGDEAVLTRPVEIARAPVAAPARPVPRVETARAADAEGAAPRVVAAHRFDDLAPEDLPPGLLERPELFLRLPVVRRLDTLEQFEALRHGPAGDRVGAAPRRRAGAARWG